MVHLLAYLAGLPHHGSPLLFPTCPQPYTCPKSININMGWPTLEGRGQVAMSLDVKRKKKVTSGKSSS